jgi:hypothetical protein
MRLTPPKHSTFWIAVVLAAVGAIAALLHFLDLFPTLTWLAPVAFVLVIVAFILLVIGLLVKGF